MSWRHAPSTTQLAEQMSAEFKFSDILKDMNLLEAIEYGLSDLISSLWKRDWAIYPTNSCLFTYGRDLRSYVIRIAWEN